MMGRHAYEDDLKAYADGELSPLRRFAVARHLARCASCRMEVAQMSQIAEQLRPETDEALDPTLRAKILSDLGPDSTSPVRAPKRRLRPAALIGAAAALGVIAYAFAPQLSSTNPFVYGKHAESAGAPAASMTPQAQVPQRDVNGFVPMTYSTDSRAAGKQARALNESKNVEVPIKAPASQYQDSAPKAAFSTDGSADVSVEAPGRLVHNEATIGIEVANAETSSSDLATLVQGVGGYVAQNSLTTDESGVRSADVTIKVPVNQFESVMTQIGKFGKVTEKSVSGEDITEKTSDADQAEQVMEDEVHRTDAQLKSRGKRVTWRDQAQAQDLRIQLNQTRARMQLLKKMARLSTIEVTLTEKTTEPTKVTSTFWTSLTASTSAATDSLAAALGRVLALAIWCIAYAPLWIPMALAYRWWVKKSKREESAA